MSDANRTATGAAQTAIVSDPTEPVGARPPTLDEHRLRQRLIGAVVVTAAIASLLVAIPVLRSVAKTISHMSPGWLVPALGSSSHRAQASWSSSDCSSLASRRDLPES